MKNLLRAGALALGLMLCAPGWAQIQHATNRYSPGGSYAPEEVPVMVPALSTPLGGAVTSTAVTPTSGAATFSNGTAYIGPFQPELGRPIRMILKGTWQGSVITGTASAANGCTAGNINPLTVGGLTWASFTANANEDVDTPHLGGILAADGRTIATPAPVYCATATITSGTLTYEVRQ